MRGDFLAQMGFVISIHVLRAEDDPFKLFHVDHHNLFQSTSSVRRTTIPTCNSHRITCYFNPRPPCGGRPDLCARVSPGNRNFNPRPPCGGRLEAAKNIAKTFLFQSTSSVRRTTFGDDISNISDLFQSTSSVRRTTAKTEKNLYLHSYNTAICIDLQSHQSAHATVCTTNPKQSPQKPVRSIRLCGDRSMFARPSPPGEVLRKSARYPAGRRGELRRVPLCSGNGCPAGKSAGCPLPGRSVWSARP